MYPVLGIDVAQAMLEVALQRTAQECRCGSFANTPAGFAQLQRWRHKQSPTPVHVCPEATGRYGRAVAAYLHAQDHVVSVVNPHRIYAYGKSKLQRNKTDKCDAKLIADFCATQVPEPWTPPTPQQQALQELTRHLDALKRELTRLRNRLAAGVETAWVRQDLQAQQANLEQRIAELEQEIARQTQHDEAQRQQMALLTSIPGIGLITAARFLAEVPDVRRFDHADQLAADAGLVPSHHTSGTSVHRKSTLCKTGNPHLRSAFYMPALNAARFNPLVRQLVDRLTQKGKPKMVIVGAVMRKLLHLAFGVLKSGQPFDPNYLNRPSAT
jgi:transposase